MNKMKVWLVSPNERKYLTSAGDRMPLPILYLSSALTENGIDNECWDLNHTHWLDFTYRCQKFKPDIVGLSIISSPSYPQMKRLAKEIRPYVGTIVAGGFHTTTLPESLNGDVNVIIRGEGESQLVNLITERNEEFDINRYPIPDRSKLDSNKYNMKLLGLKIAGITTARGCPFGCAFCGNVNKTVHFRDKHNIEEEVKQIKGLGYEAVYFYNESHTINKKHAFEVGEIMKRYKMKYRLETRANLIDEKTSKMLSDTGCMMVALGIESGDDKVLDAINKKEYVDDYRRAVKLLSKDGIPTKGYFIFGLPQQDLTSALKSIELAKELKKEGMVMADFYQLTPFPGSPITANPEKYGVRILHHDYKKYLQASSYVINPVIETEWLSREGIKSLVERARIEFKNA